MLEKNRFTKFIEPQEPCFGHDCPPGSAFRPHEDRCTYRTVLIPRVSDYFPEFSGRNVMSKCICECCNWTFKIHFLIQQNILNVLLN